MNINDINCCLFSLLKSYIGGAIYIEKRYGLLSIKQSEFRRCSAEDCGGAIRISFDYGGIEIERILGCQCHCNWMGQFLSCSFRNNQLSNNISHICIYECSLIKKTGFFSVTLKDSNIDVIYMNSTRNFVKNRVSSLYLDSFVSKTIRNSYIMNNYAEDSICIAFKGEGCGTIDQCAVINNTQGNERLGLLFCSGNCFLQLKDSDFVSYGVEAVFVAYYGVIVLENCFYTSTHNISTPIEIKRFKREPFMYSMSNFLSYTDWIHYLNTPCLFCNGISK